MVSIVKENYMNHRSKGFTLVEGLLVIIALTLVAFTAAYVIKSNKDEPSKSSSSVTTTTPQQQVTSDPTADWKDYVSPSGKFKLKYPTDWKTAPNPDQCSGNLLLLGPNQESAGKCATDGNSQISVNSFTSETGFIGLSDQYYSNIELKDVTVDGIQGRRESGTYTGDGALVGPQKGSKEVLYIFKKNGLTYRAAYVQQPGNQNVLNDFDLMITKTLRFD